MHARFRSIAKMNKLDNLSSLARSKSPWHASLGRSLQYGGSTSDTPQASALSAPLRAVDFLRNGYLRSETESVRRNKQTPRKIRTKSVHLQR